MKRLAYESLLNWKDGESRLPLILRGARQVGKTYLLKAFGKAEFEAVHHLDFERDAASLRPIFEESLLPMELVTRLSFFVGEKINPSTTLLIFDEIQNCPRALTSLKYFAEDMPDLAICAAGSLLGTALSAESFPVGKVSFLDLYPMNFEEFLLNSADEMLYEAFQSLFVERNTSSIVHRRLWDRLQRYYVVGGMPQVVHAFVNDSDEVAAFSRVRDLQRHLLDTYVRDFNKHAGSVNATHIGAVFEDIPRQISSAVDGSIKRYRFKDVVPGKRRYADLQGPIGWLVKAGLVLVVHPCSKAELPLKAFTKNNILSLRLFDVGLLGCMLELSPGSIILGDYGQTKGFFAENFVACEFTAAGEKSLHSWAQGESEIEFLRIFDSQIVPVEVKSGVRTRSRSLRQYIARYDPSKALKITANPFSAADDVIVNIPLYAAGKIRDVDLTP